MKKYLLAALIVPLLLSCGNARKHVPVPAEDSTDLFPDFNAGKVYHNYPERFMDSVYRIRREGFRPDLISFSYAPFRVENDNGSIYLLSAAADSLRRIPWDSLCGRITNSGDDNSWRARFNLPGEVRLEECYFDGADSVVTVSNVKFEPGPSQSEGAVLLLNPTGKHLTKVTLQMSIVTARYDTLGKETIVLVVDLPPRSVQHFSFTLHHLNKRVFPSDDPFTLYTYPVEVVGAEGEQM